MPQLIRPLFSITLFLVPLSVGAEAPPASSKIDGFDLEKDDDRIIFAFCKQAILQPRGLTSTTFAGPSDRWILDYLVKQPGFLDKLEATKPPFGRRKADPRPDVDSDGRFPGVEPYQDVTRATDRLHEKLNDAQRLRLPNVYLRVEGLMALCRPDFAQLFDDARTQERIRRLATEAYSERASRVHRAMFVQETLDEMPLFELELRTISSDLDLEIARLLTPAERKKLAAILTGSWQLQKIVHGAPAY